MQHPEADDRDFTVSDLAGTDDETIDRIVRRAYLPPLLAALAQATGDLSLLRDDLRPDADRPRDPQGGMSTEQRAAAREVAVEALKALRDRPARAVAGRRHRRAAAR